ncbi:MAG: methyltransferase domain-containing protein [Elusimicrobiales bacterium]|nr:methyltransferase domain-containing protein [Elusimicrobiales bacterium]
MSFKQTMKQIPGVLDLYNKVNNRFRGSSLWGYGTHADYKPELIEFIAGRRGINMEAAKKLVESSANLFKGGWGGNEYWAFSNLETETLKMFYDDDTDARVIEAYQFHGPFDLLRMASYAVPTEQDMEPILSRLAEKTVVTIVDYGCGLAHRTIAVSRFLIARGVKVKLCLVDIRRELHFAFLEFLCRKYGIEHQFIEVTADKLYPELPPCDYCDNVSVLEHVREPLTVLNNTDRALKPGGLFLVLDFDAPAEMMHITPNLKVVRDRLAELKYQKAGICYGTPLLQKPVS